MMPNDDIEVMHQSGCLDLIKTNEETEGNQTKLLTYIIRTVKCFCSKILVAIKVIKMTLLSIIIIIMIIISPRPGNTGLMSSRG